MRMEGGVGGRQREHFLHFAGHPPVTSVPASRRGRERWQQIGGRDAGMTGTCLVVHAHCLARQEEPTRP
ncbi:MAG: hypothetical protein IPL28_17150 [Chloroflexi bacterium]|nr:hypothetical protein [Chloroflexota bacterium]